MHVINVTVKLLRHYANMFRELQQVLRLVMVLGKRRKKRDVQNTRGLFVLLWTETGFAHQSLNCTVAAAGHWCKGIKMEELLPVLTDLKVSLLSCAAPFPEAYPEELCAFSELYGSIRLLLSFEIKDAQLLSPELQANLEAFLHTFSLANAGMKMQLKFKNNQQTFQHIFRATVKTKVPLTDQASLILDVTCNIQPPQCVKTEYWCQGAHPVLGSRMPLSIPSHVMDEGLYGELSIQFVTFLRPCVLQYPNLATRLTHIQVLVYSPSNVPVAEPFTFFQIFPAHLDCHKLGLHGLPCFSLKDFVYTEGIVYTVEQENWDLKQKSSFPPMEQSLLFLLFLQHKDPFLSHLSDIMTTETLIEQHLEGILSNNKQAITSAMQRELKNTLKAQIGKRQDQEKLHSALKVILSSSMSIVSCSSNMDFRNACLNSMKVHDTHELSASLCESLKRVTAWKFKPKPRCYSAQMDEHHESEPTRIEI